MNSMYCFEITDEFPDRCCFSYIDSEDGLASILFDHLKVDVEEEMVFHYDDDPFRIVMCHIPRNQREAFLRAIDLLPSFMAYAGKEGYEEYCLNLMGNAARYMRGRQEEDRVTPLQ